MENIAIKGLPKTPCRFMAYVSVDGIKYTCILVENIGGERNTSHEWTCHASNRGKGELDALAMKDVISRADGSIQVVTDSKYAVSVLTGTRREREAFEVWREVDAAIKGREVYIQYSSSLDSVNQIFKKKS